MADLPERDLPVSARATLPLWGPVASAATLAIYVGTRAGTAASLLLAAVGAVALLLVLGVLLRPPALLLDAEHLAFRTPLGVRWRTAWSDCGAFRAAGRLVVWTSPAEAARHPRAAASWRKRADADTGVAAQFGGLTAAELAELLNRYRTGAARAR